MPKARRINPPPPATAFRIPSKLAQLHLGINLKKSGRRPASFAVLSARSLENPRHASQSSVGPPSAGGRILFIINPAAGANRALHRWSALRLDLLQKAFHLDQAFTRRPGETAGLAREAASQYDFLVAVGGDGTVSEVADGILSTPRSRATLAIVPFGTGNDLAGLLGIRTADEAVRSILAGHTRPIDAIRVQCLAQSAQVERYALLFAAVGIVAESLKKTSPAIKRIFGQHLAYPVGLVRALLSYQSPAMRVRCDLESFEDKFLFVAASNSEVAGGGMRIAPGARLDDGLLNINLVQSLGRWRAVLQLRRLCRGQHLDHPRVCYTTARELEIQTPSLEIAADGELIGRTPALIQVRPKALPVRVP
ncbi:MAG TPA: diacylglycerol kinase family protein [Patescibacteria group bacterium]|nr:diacylglycerol kinase family protein [Patescibacteria group bacterium]